MSSPLDLLAAPIQDDITEELQEFARNNGITATFEEDAKELARIAARSIIDPTQPKLKKFEGIPLDSENTSDFTLQYLLVLEFLESAGFKFAANVLRYESQHPEQTYERNQFGRDLGLLPYDKTPYLVQLIDAGMKSN